MSVSRQPATTVMFIDQYCSLYRSLFTDVRSFEQFIHLGLIADLPRKSLPVTACSTMEQLSGSTPLGTAAPVRAQHVHDRELRAGGNYSKRLAFHRWRLSCRTWRIMCASK